MSRLRITKRLAKGTGSALLVVVATTLAARYLLQRRIAGETAIHSDHGIETLEKLQLGGVEQWVWIRGRDRSKPVLLFLHGGPGFSAMPLAQVNAALADDFVVVHWDQRGTGKSWSPAVPPGSMTVEQIVADTGELTERLQERFGAAKIFLVAHSWGTIIGARAAAWHPERYAAYVAISQVANPVESERAMYRYALQAARLADTPEAEAALHAIGLPPYRSRKDFHTMNRWIHHFAETEYQEITPREFAALAFASPLYTWTDFYRLWRGYRFSFSHLWREAFATDFFAELPRLEVPVFFFLGRHDHTSTVSAEEAARYFAQLDAPAGKELVWFEHSGHWPHLNEPEKYRAELAKFAGRTH